MKRMPIALLKIPTDLLRDVFEQCNPLELYCLSKCSKRARKSLTLRDTRDWKISYGESKKIWIWCEEGEYNFKHTTNPDQYYKISFSWPQSGPSMFVDLSDRGDLFNYLLETFKISIVESMNNDDQDIDFLRQTARTAIHRNMEVEQVTLYNMENTRDVLDFMPILDQMKITQNFSCSVRFPSNFQHQFIMYPNEIRIHNSIWFNIGQLLDCTCVKIKLCQSMLSNQEFDVFLQKWKKAGTFPNLRSLEIWSKKIDNESPILEMIPPINIVDNPLIKVSFGKRDLFEISEAVRVIKDDGTEGWLKVELGEWPTFEFLVVSPGNSVVAEIGQRDEALNP
ncbi:hypothetical protein L3Y34_016214 [Caenorhabditis briggsae]|nr:hypothetical protein L3Y34_016212 [Caenorhabditis briggsae]ULU13562.1 hypothetical protein L3Y34_016214 [Caenorhabditis briggsae]